MMRSTLAKQLRYNIACEKAEDYDLWERGAEAGWKMTNVPEVLLLYRVHAAQISTKTANLQQLQTQAIRRRYWEFVCHSKQLNWGGIDEIMRVFESSLSETDMDAVDALFTEVFRQSHGEAKDVVFDHVTRLYLKIAASCPDIVSRWGRLNREFGKNAGNVTKLQLWIFRTLKIRADSDVFKQLKKIYIWRASR
jgi:hypothetical protein